MSEASAEAFFSTAGPEGYSAGPLLQRLPGRGSSAVARFTVDGDDGLEAGLARTCERVVSGIRGLIPERKLQAILLGGGYGRGEGGVLRGPEGDRPYNDMEFYVALTGNRHVNELLYRRPLEVLAQILTHLADVEVEFKICALRELADGQPSMFSYDLLAGHRQIWGDPRALTRCSGHRRANAMPTEEATRLMMNRCAGLLLAAEKLSRPEFPETASDFVGRNLAKAQLAIGDAVLTVAGQYHWSCRERNRRLNKLSGVAVPELDAIRRHHEAGVEFKLHPSMGGKARSELALLHEEVTALALRVWLWIESRRVSRSYTSARAYAGDAINHFPHTPALRNLVLNVRSSGPGILRDHRRRWRHPRERVLRVLTLLLWEPEALTNPALLARVQAELHTSADNFDGLMAVWTKLWRQVQ